MSSISSTNLTQLFAAQRPQHSGKNRVSDAIQSETASGQISATDATALTSALDSIDTSLSADRSASQSSSSTSTASSGSDTRLDPSKIKDRIDGLIADQVTSGSLTSAQADTLKQLFAQGPGGQHGQGSTGGDEDGFSVGSADAGGGTGRVGHGHRGPPPGPPPSDVSDASSSTTTSSSATTGVASADDTGTGSVNDLLKSFIEQLQATQSSATGYTGGGTAGSGSRQASALLFDFNS